MLELNSKPKKLVVQRHTKSCNWLTEAELYRGKNDNRSFTEDEILRVYNCWAMCSEESIRILNEYDKVILSSASLEFLQGIGNAAIISVIYDDKEQVHYSDCNKIYPPKREFQKYIGRHGGINNVTIYPIDESDGYLECCKVYLKDGTFVTVAGLC